MTTLSIIVPVRNDAGRLARCLASIAASQSAAAPELIVADNGSTDSSVNVAERAGARVLSLPGLRVSALRNAAARTASGDLLAFVDADHEVGAGWTEAALSVITDPSAGAAGARYTAPPGGTWVQEMYGLLRGRTVGAEETDWLGSGNMVVRREAFNQVGGFDESLEACEDVDLCRRLRSAGYKIIGDERLLSIHHGDPPTLGALFRAERWRGRDNLRVSLRGAVRARDLPSVVIPILSLAAILALVVSPVAALMGRSGAWLAISAAAVILVLAALRALRMTANAKGVTLRSLPRAFSAALVYDTARAAALVGRARHHRP